MKIRLSSFLLATALSIAFAPLIFADEPIAPIARVLPPENGLPLPADLARNLGERVTSFTDRIWEVDQKTHVADVAVLVKAVDFALKHGEFYSEKDFPLAAELLDLAETRLQSLNADDQLPWLKERGLIVRGYRSSIDDSYQPFGLEIPESLDLSKPVPLLVWLHGRGDKTTDLHFLNQCRKKSQSFGGFYKDQNEAIVLHPFGRQCVGWKHAGEIDVFEAIAAVMADYPVDPDRIILAGFSMGGAGAWHLGAHYRDRFCGVHAGAGFAETKEYNKLTPDRYPPDYEQTLWQVYDVPNYLENFLNGPLLAYSGAKDKQKATADLMERELAKVGHSLRHVVAPETEHKYTPEAVAEIRTWLGECWKNGRGLPAETIRWQTPTLRYGTYDWLHLTGLESHWKGAKVEAKWDREARSFMLSTQGVTALEIASGPKHDLAGASVTIDGQALSTNPPGFSVNSLSFIRREGRWSWGEPDQTAKRPGLQGPIDDAFMSRFIVVPPDQAPASARVARWVDFELDHFRSRWRALMRGDLPERAADELDSDDLRDANLILWGDPESNPMIAEIASKLPVVWKEDSFVLRGTAYPRDAHVPVLIFPNPLNPDRYIVLNSGLTFREGHDKTNSLQNPKLPDWAVIGLDRDPDAFTPGRVAAAGFFDEQWK
jgi:pimeloyl-ACP methyl ester carboxylesterase